MRDKSARFQSAAGAPTKSLSLFNQNSSADYAQGSLNDDSLVRNTITSAIKQSGTTRAAIADEMTRLLGVRVTERSLTAFTSESKELHRWPGAWDRAFCVAVGNDDLLKCRVEAAGYKPIRDEEIQLLELGRQYLRRKRANEEAEMLERRLAGADL